MPKNADRTGAAVRGPSQPDHQLEELFAGWRGGRFRTGEKQAGGSRRRPEGSSCEDRRTYAGQRFLSSALTKAGLPGATR